MKAICIISFIICAGLVIICGLSLFDIIDFPLLWHGIFGVTIIVTLGIFIKTFIRLRKRTGRY